jgi:hypothetical protein
MIKRKPHIKTVTPEYLKRRFGSAEAVSLGSTIYITKKTPRIALEHEKVHIELGHTKPNRLNAYQFATREMKAEKISHDRLHLPIKGHSLKITAEQTEQVFRKGLGKNPTKAELRELKDRADKATNKAARKLGIPYRIIK